MIISVDAVDGPHKAITLGQLKELCRQAEAAGGHDGNQITGLTRGFKGRQIRVSVDTASGLRPEDERHED